MNWRDVIKGYGIEYIHSFPYPQLTNQIFTTHCSAQKNNISEGLPKQLYKSNTINNFVKFCECNKYRYGIISDLHGIVLMDEIIKWYDIHPSKLQESDFDALGNKIREKCKGIDEIYFYNTSPLMSRPYFRILSHTKMKVYYLTQLKSYCGFEKWQ